MLLPMEVTALLNALESPRPRDYEAVKSDLATLLSNVRDTWLVHGLVTYQVRTGSARAVDVLTRCPEHHARHVFDKLSEGLRSEWRGAAVVLLGQIVRLQPLWLHQIASHPLLPQLLKLLVTERDISVLMSGLLALVSLLPMIPSIVVKHFNDILEVLKRLAAWDARGDQGNNPAVAGRRAHLQLGLYALFYNLYGMYPCNLLDFLKREYGGGNGTQREIFNHTIRPMLDTVKLHPLLVTASKQQETQGGRFQKMEHHDILDECRRFSLEGTERPLAAAAAESQFRSRCGTDVATLVTAQHHMESGKASTSAPNLTEAQTHMKTTLTISRMDPNSIAYISKTCDAVEPGSDRWFSLADGCAGTTPSAPHTPLPVGYSDIPPPRTPLAHLHPSLDGGSPPETAIEATPENTPIKELGGTRRFNFPANSSTVRALGTGLQQRPGFTHVQPSQSQPPSPLKKEPSPFGRLGEQEMLDGRKDRLNRVVLERAQAETAAARQQGSGSPQKRSSFYSQAGSVPNSPIPIGAGAPASGTTDWPLAKPKPKREGIHLETPRDYTGDSNKEDREVTELTMRGGGVAREEGETPARGLSEPYGEEWGVGEDEPACESDEICRARGHGLHMPPSASMMQVARLMSNRLRYYSQCGPDRPETGGSLPKSTSDTRPSRSNTREPRARLAKVASCPDLLKNKNKTSEMQTQTVDTWPAAYELSLSDMFQGLSSADRAGRRRTETTPAPVIAAGGTYAACEQLDRYIEELVRNAGNAGGIEALSEQLQLTHAQLQYERHRKEVHAYRNRRLLGKCRKNRAIEERAAELAERCKSLQAENEELRAQTARQSAAASVAEMAARTAAVAAHDKRIALEAELAEERRVALKLAAELEDTRRRASEDSADRQQLLAAKFDLAAKLERALRAGEASDRLAECVQALQRELLICGERDARITEVISTMAPAPNVCLERLLQQYRDEAATTQDILAANTAKLEAAVARQSELEAALVVKDAIIVDLKKHKLTIQDEYEARSAALEEKYTCLLRINQKLECRVLELLRVPGAAGGSCAGGGSTGSAASAHSSPLSASVASSEGPLGSHVALSDVTNLHHLLEQPGTSNDNDRDVL